MGATVLDGRRKRRLIYLAALYVVLQFVTAAVAACAYIRLSARVDRAEHLREDLRQIGKPPPDDH